MQQENPLRALPSVNELLQDERLVALEAEHGHELALEAARRAIEAARERVSAGEQPEDIVADALDILESTASPRLRRVLNATGVIVHTNLGRAPLAALALERIREVAGGYSNLEYDLEEGTRGSRQDHIGPLLRDLTGA
jgi:L-seryl-tRNA(Ser) seleniumtransferase